MSSVDLQYESLVVRVSAPAEQDLEWLTVVLECGFDAIEAGLPAATVTLTIDAARYDALTSREHGQAVVEAFAQDAQPYLAERWGNDGDVTIVRDASLPGFYLIDAARSAVEIVMPVQLYACRLALMRVVRELAMDRSIASGAVVLHGAALHTDAGIVVLSGPKRSGKTTLLLSLLDQRRAAYVSSDRCLVRIAGDQATVRGLPTIVSVTRNGLAMFPTLRDRLFAVRPDLISSGGSHVGFGPHQLSRVLQVAPVSSGPLAACLFPAVTMRAERLTVRRLAPTDAVASLRRGLFRSNRATVLGELFVSESVRGRSAWELGATAADWIGAHVPCFEVALGGGAPPDATECAALAATVEQAARERTC